MTAPDQIPADLAAIDTESWAGLLAGRRWFVDRGEPIVSAAPIVAAGLAGRDRGLVFVLLEVTIATGLHDRYQLLLEQGGSPPLRDALERPESAMTLVDLAAEGCDIPAGSGTLRFRSRSALSGAPHAASARVLPADTSNTTAVVDEEVLVKVYRRLSPGTHPELEMLAFLARSGFEGVPELLGWWEHVDESSGVTLGILQRFVPDAVDGWDLALASASTGATDPEFLSAVAALGTLTAELHTALAGPPDEFAFAPERAHADQVGLLAAALDEDLTEAASLPQLADRPDLVEAIRARLALAASGHDLGPLMRCHGDFHLGQVLRARGRWWVVDFEGEPLRDHVERRRRNPPLRDVAGLLRSIDYADGVARARGASVDPAWRRSARRAYLDAYLAAASGSGLLPRQEAAIGNVLFLMELEKVLYELRYELAHRPDWIAIPLAGLEALLDEDRFP